MKTYRTFILGLLVLFIKYGAMACNPPHGPSTDDMDLHGPPGWDGTYLTGQDSDDDFAQLQDLFGNLRRRSLAKFQQHPSPGYIFSVMDDNSDGNIDACEWMEAGMTTNVREYVKLLDRVDKNGDNVLSPEEFSDIHVRWRYGEGIDADDKQN
ncbi:uncharacterized protein [Apostichopus japonicus]|uniref:uncharacterized protein isoform X1 n=1 Tax=Stichopus japonicus TaxID=307972 RepID=UPI003AB20847